MSAITNFAEANQRLGKFVSPAKVFKDAVASQQSMRGLMDYLGNPQHKYKAVHVAGTSGKTSTCYYVAAMLEAAGKKVGLTVSPHVDAVNERVQINLTPLPEAVFCMQLTKFLELLENAPFKPSYFEVMVAFAYWQFAQEKVDYAVVEVGMGGLLDATNVVESPDKVCVITDIGFDHTEFLGETLAAITLQKAGIIKTNNHVFVHQQNDEVMAVLQSESDKKQAQLHIAALESAHSFLAELPLFQQRNWLLAELVTKYVVTRDDLKITSEKLAQTVATYIPARMEVQKYEGKTLITDASHNGQKLHALMTSIKERYPDDSIAALVSFSSGDMRRVQEGLDEIMASASYIIFTAFSGLQDAPKTAVPPEELVAYCASKGLTHTEIIAAPKAALAAAIVRPESLLVIAGSFYLLNHIRPLIMKQHNKGHE